MSQAPASVKVAQGRGPVWTNPLQRETAVGGTEGEKSPRRVLAYFSCHLKDWNSQGRVARDFQVEAAWM